jgi:hypothetical protein
MPVVTMMWTGGQRSLTAAASEDGANIVATFKDFDRLVGICHSNNVIALIFQRLADVQAEQEFVFDDKDDCQNALLLTTKPGLKEFVPDRTKNRRELPSHGSFEVSFDIDATNNCIRHSRENIRLVSTSPSA